MAATPVTGTAAGLILLALLLACPAPAARAQERPDAEAAPAPPVGTMEQVVVTATRSPAAALGVPASVTVVGAEELALREPVRPGDALADVPGLYIRGAAMGTAFPGTGQAVLSLRGIPRTPRTLVMIDGQPVNTALTGGINVAGIPLASVERVEVVRGPYSALYGGAAMGGVINFITATPDAPLSELRVGAGSLHQRSAVLVHRRRYDSGLGIAFSAAWHESAGYPDSDDVIKRPVAGATGVPVSGAQPTTGPDGLPGYRVGTQGARPWAQSNAQLSLHWSPSAVTTLVGGVGWGEYSVGYSRPDSFLRDAGGSAVFAGPVTFGAAGTPTRLSLDNTDWLTATPSGERDRRLFARMEHRYDDGSRLRAQLGTLRHDFYFTQGTAGTAGYDFGPGTLTDQPNQRTDFDLSLHTPLSPSWALVGGLSLHASELNQRTVGLASWRDTDSHTTLLTQGSGTARNAALYFQSEHDLADGLVAYLGGRYDYFRTEGRVLQNTAPAFDIAYPVRSFDQFSPKLALVWQARPRLSLRVSYGQGFRPPALFDMYGRVEVRVGPVTRIVDAAPDLRPERVRAFEVGADLAVAGGGRASVSLYSQRLLDLIYSQQAAGSTPTFVRIVASNAGEAQVDGMEASVRWPTAWRGLVAFGSLTQQFRYDVTRNDAVPASVGKRLTDVPRTMWSAGLEYAAGPWSGLLQARHVSHVFGSADNQNLNVVEGVLGSYDAYTVLAARVGWRFDRHVALSVSVDNLTDRRYFVFYRQPGRTVFAEIAYRF